MKIVFRTITAVLLTGLFVVFSGACGGNNSSSAPTLPVPFIVAELVSYLPGSAPTGFNSGAAVTIKESPSGGNIADATVSMNGISLSYSVPDQQYVGDVVVFPGQAVTLSAIVGGGTYTVVGNQFTTYPVISAPVSGDVLPASAPILVKWSGGTPILNAAGYGIGILNANDSNGPLVWPGDGHFLPIAITNFDATVPASSLAAGSYLVLSCIASNYMAIPNAAVDSAFMLIGCSYVLITVVP